jgi:uncharacterized protein (DUF1800 family)
MRSVAFLALLLCWLLPQPAAAASNPPIPSNPSHFPTVLTPTDLHLLERTTFGVNGSLAADFARLGRDRWLNAQLHPGAKDRLPAAAQAIIEGLPITTTAPGNLALSLGAQARAANQTPDPEQKKAAQQAYQQTLANVAGQAAMRSLLRALYSEDQLREKMTWFWLNHFNVFQAKADIRTFIADYENRAIRPHALGRFRDLLMATLRHPAMLRYLDNAENVHNHLNENYSREIMELHTMGVGSGYTQEDVQELARILTGVGINLQPPPQGPTIATATQSDYIRDGAFEFNPKRHDYSLKHFLGHTIMGYGFAEVEQAIDILARHPATANHVSLRLATYFVADVPPAALVARMAQRFRATDGDIASVLLELFRSAEFNASAKMKFKDPVEYVLSAVRLAYDDKVIANTAPMQSWLARLGEALYGRETPDGYPLTSAAWNGPGQLALRFEIARQIGSSAAGLFKQPTPYPPPLAGEGREEAFDRPAFPQIANALYFNSLQLTLAPATRAALDRATSPQEWNTIFLSSPEFMR